jgi:hypothetical protein
MAGHKMGHHHMESVSWTQSRAALIRRCLQSQLNLPLLLPNENVIGTRSRFSATSVGIRTAKEPGTHPATLGRQTLCLTPHVSSLPTMMINIIVDIPTNPKFPLGPRTVISSEQRNNLSAHTLSAYNKYILQYALFLAQGFLDGPPVEFCASGIYTCHFKEMAFLPLDLANLLQPGPGGPPSNHQSSLH